MNLSRNKENKSQQPSGGIKKSNIERNFCSTSLSKASDNFKTLINRGN